MLDCALWMTGIERLIKRPVQLKIGGYYFFHTTWQNRACAERACLLAQFGGIINFLFTKKIASLFYSRVSSWFTCDFIRCLLSGLSFFARFSRDLWWCKWTSFQATDFPIGEPQGNSDYTSLLWGSILWLSRWEKQPHIWQQNQNFLKLNKENVDWLSLSRSTSDIYRLKTRKGMV